MDGSAKVPHVGFRKVAFYTDGVTALSNAEMHGRMHWRSRTVVLTRFQLTADPGQPARPGRAPAARYPTKRGRSGRSHESGAEGCENSWPVAAPKQATPYCQSPGCGPGHHGLQRAADGRRTNVVSFVVHGSPAARTIPDRQEGVVFPSDGAEKSGD